MKIPRNMFQEGIDLCRENALNYLNEAKIIARKGFLHHAYVSVQLAIEETGKAIWLKGELKNGSTDPVNVPDVIFGKGKNARKSHQLKFERASKMLDPDLLWVCKGIFNRKMFNSKLFNAGKEASPETRLLNAYVHFDEQKQKWYIGCNIDKSKVDALIRNVQQVVLAL